MSFQEMRTTGERFAERLKAYRVEEGSTQEQLADMLGVTRMTYGYYENAKRTPDIDFLNNVHSLTGYTMEYLLGESEYRTMQEEAEAVQIAPDGVNSTSEAAQKAVLISRTVKNLLKKYALEGEDVVGDYLRPLADLCQLIDEIIKGFTYEKDDNGETVKKFYADYFFEIPNFTRRAHKVCTEILEGGF